MVIVADWDQYLIMVSIATKWIVFLVVVISGTEYLLCGDCKEWHQHLMVMIAAVVNNAEPDGDISGMQSLLGGDRIRGMELVVIAAD